MDVHIDPAAMALRKRFSKLQKRLNEIDEQCKQKKSLPISRNDLLNDLRQRKLH